MAADRYPTVFDAVALHEFIMQRTGAGPAGLRDEGALAAALARAQHAAFYEGASLAGQAVLLLVGVAPAHGFADGNKRTAFIVYAACERHVPVLPGAGGRRAAGVLRQRGGASPRPRLVSPRLHRQARRRRPGRRRHSGGAAGALGRLLRGL